MGRRGALLPIFTEGIAIQVYVFYRINADFLIQTGRLVNGGINYQLASGPGNQFRIGYLWGIPGQSGPKI